MLAATVLALVAGPAEVSKVQGPAAVPGGGAVTPLTPGEPGKKVAPRKSCLDVDRPGDQALVQWSLFRPKARADQQRWRALLDATPAEARTPTLLSEGWRQTEGREPCFLFLQAIASLGAGEAVDALRAASEFLAVDPTRTTESDREAARQIWEGATEYDLAFTIAGRTDPATPVRGQAAFTGLGVPDAPFERAYCEARPERCTARPFSLVDDGSRLQLPVGRWRLTLEDPFVFVDAAGKESQDVEQEIRARPPKTDGSPVERDLPTLTARFVPPSLPPQELPVEPASPLQVTPPPNRDVEPTNHRRIRIAGLGVGGVALVTGGVLVGVGAARWNRTHDLAIGACGLDDANSELEQCRRELGRAASLRSGGAAVLGVGTGVMVASLLWWNARSGADWQQQRKIRGGVGIGVGALIAIGSGVGIAVARSRFQSHYGGESDAAWADHEVAPMTLHAVVATGLGLGLGLAAASAVHWAIYRPRKPANLQVMPLRLREGAGLALYGRF